MDGSWKIDTNACFKGDVSKAGEANGPNTGTSGGTHDHMVAYKLGENAL